MIDEFLKRFGDLANSMSTDWRLARPELMATYQAACEERTRQYRIGPLTMKQVFAANGMVNMHNLQRVLDCVEVELEKKIREPQGLYNLGVEAAAQRVGLFWRHRRGVMNCTELCAEIRTLKKAGDGDDMTEFVEVVPVPPEIKEQAEREELLSNLFPYANNTPLLCETKSALEDASLSAPPVYPDSFDWHYVECKNHGPNDKSLCGWFPTLQLANAHRNFWPQHLKDCMVIKPRSIVDPGIALYFPDQAGSDVLRHTNEFLVANGLAKVGLGDRYFPEPAKAPMVLTPADQDEIRNLRGQLSDMAKLLHGMPPQNGSLVARLEALVERAAEMGPRSTIFGAGEWEFSLGDRVFKPKGSWWEGKIVGFYSTAQTPRGYAVQLQTRDDNGPVQIYPESALEYRP